LAWSALLTLALALPYATGLILERGLWTMMGNRENFAPVTGWKDRAIRAHRNMIENIAPFAAVVLAAHAAGVSNEMTVLGAALFFWARVVHAIVFIAGIPVVRTLAYFVGVIGTVIVFLQLLGGAAEAMAPAAM
jgi:uncharacterized MAPEG superfamily protein